MPSTKPSVNLPPKKAVAKRCGCDVPTCDGTCCDLDCLVQPRFFCGQLLTDQDLTTLLTWSQDKFRLSRYRDGWGVVCGLEVRCDHENPGYVIVEPGYAVDCCGNDVLVCEPTSIDLSDACRPEVDPCEEFGKKDEGYGRYTRANAASQVKINLREGMKARKIARQIDFKMVDLFLQYAEKGSQAVATLSRNGCHQTSNCEYSRMEESFVLNWRPALDADPATYRAEKWREQYFGCVDVIVAFNDMWQKLRRLELSPEESVARLRAWLLHWLDKNPLDQFCFIRDVICELSAEDFSREQGEYAIFMILFYLAQDCRNSFLSGHCHKCEDDPGVPLARIRLLRDENECQVYMIDSFPPYRRPSSTGRWPALPGTVNGGQVIWHRDEDACVTLRGLGVNVVGAQTPSEVDTLPELAELLRQDPFLPACTGQPVELIVAELDGMSRVIGFAWEDEQYERPGIVREKSDLVAPSEEDENKEDDLTAIRGISQNRAEILKEANVYSHAALAETPTAKLKELFNRVGEAELNRWRDQARELAQKGTSGS